MTIITISNGHPRGLVPRMEPVIRCADFARTERVSVDRIQSWTGSGGITGGSTSTLNHDAVGIVTSIRPADRVDDAPSGKSTSST